jgi:hypothetical protein
MRIELEGLIDAELAVYLEVDAREKGSSCQFPATETRLDASRDRATFFGRSIGLQASCPTLVSAMSAIALITRASPSVAARIARVTPTTISAIARKR